MVQKDVAVSVQDTSFLNHLGPRECMANFLFTYVYGRFLDSCQIDAGIESMSSTFATPQYACRKVSSTFGYH